MITVLTVAGTLFLCGIVLLLIEFFTLKDETPGNHITAAMREAFKKQPGVFVLTGMLLGFIVGAVSGHIFWP